MTKRDINDPGLPNTTQRLIYDSARATTPLEWEAVAELADRILEAMPAGSRDTEVSLLVNSVAAAATHAVTLQLRLNAAWQHFDEARAAG